MSVMELGQRWYWGKSAESELTHLSKRWGFVLASGISFVVLGMLALSTAGLTTIVTMFFFGWVMVFAGIVQLFEAFVGRERGRFIFELCSAIFYFVAGGMLLTSPGISAIMLTFMLAPLFMILGAARFIGAIIMRDSKWGWQMLSGVITLLLGLMIFNRWPASSFWLIGTFIGIELVFEGFALSTFALALRKRRVETANRVAA